MAGFLDRLMQPIRNVFGRSSPGAESVDSPPSPPPREKIESALRDDDPHAGYEPSRPLSIFFDGSHNLPPMYRFFQDLPAMLRCEELSLSLDFYKAGVTGAKFEIEASSPAVQQYVEEGYDRLWRLSLPQIQLGYEWGWSPCQIRYEQVTGMLTFAGLDDFEPRDCVPLKVGNEYVGFRVRGGAGNEFHADLWGPGQAPSKGFWYVHRGHAGLLHGWSQVYEAWRPWRRLAGRDGAEMAVDQGIYRFAYHGVIVRYPSGSSEATKQEGAGRKDKREQAIRLAEAAKAGMNAAISSERDDKGNYKWDLDWPDHKGFRPEATLEYIKYLVREIRHGVGVPSELLEAADSGSGYSGRQIPLEAYFMAQQNVATSIAKQAKEQIFDPLVKWNFGDGAKFDVKVMPLLATRRAEQQPWMGGGQQPGEPEPAADGGGAPGFTPYTGPRGGRGRINPATGKVSYGMATLATAHAPKGGNDVDGKHYDGGQFTPNDIPIGDQARVSGFMVKRLGDDHYRIETPRGHIAGPASKIQEHIGYHSAAAKAHGKALPAALERAAQYDEPTFMDSQRLADHARAFAKLPHGSPVVSLHDDTYGRAGKIVRDESGKNRVKLDGEDGYASNHVEPINPEQSWRVPKPKQEKPAKPIQGTLFATKSTFPAYRETDLSGGRWITIGGVKGDDGKRKGGSPVYIVNGRIAKGHASLTGKAISALKEDGGDKSEPKRESDHYAAKVSPGGSHSETAHRMKQAAYMAGVHRDHAAELRAMGWEENKVQRAIEGLRKAAKGEISSRDFTREWEANYKRHVEHRGRQFDDPDKLDRHRAVGMKHSENHELFSWLNANFPRTEKDRKATLDAIAAPGQELNKKQKWAQHQSEMAQSRKSGRQAWAGKARTEGIDPAHLHQLAAEIIAHDREFVNDRIRLLQNVRQTAKHYGVNLESFHLAEAKGQQDVASIKRFDEIVGGLVSEHPEQFLGHRDDPEQRVYDLLVEGNPEPMSEDDAYEQAFEKLLEHRYDAKPEPSDDYIPFATREEEAAALLLGMSTVSQPVALDAAVEPILADVRPIMAQLTAKAREEVLAAATSDQSPEKRLAAVQAILDKHRVKWAALLSRARLVAMLQGMREYAPAAADPATVLETAEAIPADADPGDVAIAKALAPMAQSDRDAALASFDQDRRSLIAGLLDQPGVQFEPPPPDEPWLPFGYDDDDADGVTFPLIDNAVKDLRERRVMTRAEFDKLDAQARADAFTVAGVESDSTLDSIRNAMAETAEEGPTLRDFKSRVEESVGHNAFLSDAHAENVYRTNLHSAYSKGREEILTHPMVEDQFPYRAAYPILDNRCRPWHAATATAGIDGTNVYNALDPTWAVIQGPSDYNCRCGWGGLTVAQAAARGVQEAQEWLRTGIPPRNPQFVPLPRNWQQSPGWVRMATAHANKTDEVAANV